MEYINLVLVRYDEPKTTLGVHYTDGPHTRATLVAPDELTVHFELGNEIEYTMDDIWNHIPLEWKSPRVTEEWIRARVTAYDKITLRPR